MRVNAKKRDTAGPQVEIVMTEGRLDELADRFIKGRVRELTGVRFERYVTDSDHYDQVAALLKSGRGLRVVGERIFVTPPRSRQA